MMAASNSASSKKISCEDVDIMIGTHNQGTCEDELEMFDFNYGVHNDEKNQIDVTFPRGGLF